MANKERVDVLLVEQGWFDSREKAKAAVMAGLVFLGDEKIEKAGMKVPRPAEFQVKGKVHPYVGRGGLKLKKAIDEFHINMTGSVVLDIGASTGGFTDCALQHGASFVYALDVGYNQLAWSLRQDPRVKVMERTNFRHVTRTDLDGPLPDFATIDVSFISLKLIFPPLAKMLEGKRAGIIALIKPQFEAGKEHVGKSGVVRDPKVHREVLSDILRAAEGHRFLLQGLTWFPHSRRRGEYRISRILAPRSEPGRKRAGRGVVRRTEGSRRCTCAERGGPTFCGVISLPEANDLVVLFLILAAVAVWLGIRVKQWLDQPVRFRRLPIRHASPVPAAMASLLEKEGYRMLCGKFKISLRIMVNGKRMGSRLFFDGLARGEEGTLFAVKKARDRQPVKWTGSGVRDFFSALLYFGESGRGHFVCRSRDRKDQKNPI